MGASLAHGVRQSGEADGWLVALADMPGIATADAERVAGALRAGAPIAVPLAHGRRGHPVGFGQKYRAALIALTGDQGARSILEKNASDIVELSASLAANWHDIDSADDLLLARQWFDKSPVRR